MVSTRSPGRTTGSARLAKAPSPALRLGFFLTALPLPLENGAAERDALARASSSSMRLLN
jgi:hypothetical protein